MRYVLVLLSLTICLAQPALTQQSVIKFDTYQDLITWIQNPTDDYVMVVAHRGDWRNAPENSIRAVQNCIEMGVDIVEIDVRMTQDSQLVIIHDLTLDRTTTGKGKVVDWPLDSIRTLYLKNGAGSTTTHRMPTLTEMMQFVKDKPILLNLDKAWDFLPKTYEILKQTGTISQAIFKGNEPLSAMREQYGKLLDSIHYMPIVWPMEYNIYGETAQSPELYAQHYMENFDPFGFEVIYDTEDSPTFKAIELMKKENAAVWVNTLWDQLCAGHTDDKAQDNPDAHWGWVIDHGANIIQTDRPALLLTYLRKKGLHD